MDYAGVLLEKEGKFLFQLRDCKPNISNPHKWGIFGGGIETGETPKIAAMRELKEELNLDVKGSQLLLVAKINSFNKKYYIYYSKIDLPISNLDLAEGVSIGHFSLKQILFKRNVVLTLRLFLFLYYLKFQIRKWRK